MVQARIVTAFVGDGLPDVSAIKGDDHPITVERPLPAARVRVGDVKHKSVHRNDLVLLGLAVDHVETVTRGSEDLEIDCVDLRTAGNVCGSL